MSKRQLLKKLLRTLLRGNDRKVHRSPLHKAVAEAMDATVPKNNSGNNASVR